MFGSIQKRLEEDLQQLVPSMMKFKVTAQANTVERRYSAWIGGSILSSLGTFQQMWLSKAEYKEYGAGFIHKKAP
jgi:actin-like protein 6A